MVAELPPGYTAVTTDRVEHRTGNLIDAVLSTSRAGRRSMRLFWCVRVLVDGRWFDGYCHETLDIAIEATEFVLSGDGQAIKKLAPTFPPDGVQWR
ncbi:hypothetical protein [Leifsonia sp. Leaf264]|uniref:hypothetical protein n=1 Tax=Leifsonia sp. Leaf264 TaxID=1736314 RepID=UPI0006F7AE11|nr:hypothetical protein [Leifsonia sp. Leaf264]KQP01441.1 hypothetical protein ASF30_02145 [Leifsonia sp. Leaf264]